MSGNPVYSLYGPGPSMTFSVPHEDYFNRVLGIWIGGKHVSYGCCRPISMHKVWRALGLKQQRVEHLSSLQQGVAMRWARVVPIKHGMAALTMALKEVEVK